MILETMMSQGATDVLFLNVTTDETSVQKSLTPEGLCGLVQVNKGRFIFISVLVKQGEHLRASLERIVCGRVHVNTLVVCQLESGILGTTEILTGLGSYFDSLVGESGLVLITECADNKELDYSIAKRTILFELAGVGLIPGGDRSLNNYNGFAVYFEKVPFSIRNPNAEDVDDLLVIDKESWKELSMQYSSTLIQSWVQNNSKGILVMEGHDGEVVGVMYTQRIQNGDLVDSMSWKNGIAESAGLVDKPKDSNINKNGTIKQLMRVSTRRGGGGVDKYVPGTTLREFALNVAAAEGITEVVSLSCLFGPEILFRVQRN